MVLSTGIMSIYSIMVFSNHWTRLVKRDLMPFFKFPHPDVLTRWLAQNHVRWIPKVKFIDGEERLIGPGTSLHFII